MLFLINFIAVTAFVGVNNKLNVPDVIDASNVPKELVV
jgi:hypothetical protein